jgi:hypothetical protein
MRWTAAFVFTAFAFAQEPAPPSADTQSRTLESARFVALRYAQSLPDFLCSQIVRRYHPRGQSDWKLQDTLLIRLAYVNNHEDYQLAAINGRPTTRDYKTLEGATSTGEFGSLLRRIFHPDSHTEFQWDHWADLRGRRVLVFAFHVPIAYSRHGLAVNTRAGMLHRVMVSDRGHVSIDAETFQTLRILSHSEQIPDTFEITAESTTVDYDYLDIDGHRHLLPLHAEVLMSTRRIHARNLIQFTGYRQFSANSTITFDTPPPVPEEMLREARPVK